MPSSSSSSSPHSSHGQCRSSTSTKKAKPGSHDVDWADITDPEERRRVQNRLAQRKFREKARDHKERSERESRNQEHAGNSYRIPSADEIDTASDLSGLPWGSVNLSHVVSRGHAESRKSGSGHGAYAGDEGYAAGSYSRAQYGQGFYTASYGSSGTGDESYYDQAAYVYSQPFDPLPQAYTPR